jgi:predicted nucleic acid-binding Zn ribbon protein
MRPGKPQPIGDVLAELLARRGYARMQSGEACAEAWASAAGEPLAAHSRAVQVRRGVLEVRVRHSALVQEIGYQKRAILERLSTLLPDEKIHDLKFRVGPLG